MLGKLLKYEFKETSRFFVLMYTILAVLTVLLKAAILVSEKAIFLSSRIDTFFQIVHGFLFGVYAIVVIGTIFLSVFLLIKRFYTHMFGDEGYLTHTLPVTGGQLLSSKLICSFVWILLLFPVYMLSFLIVFGNSGLFETFYYYGSELLHRIYDYHFSLPAIALIVLELGFLFLIGILSSLVSYYLAITLGQHFMGNHRLAGAVLFYFILSIISSAFTSIYTAILESTFIENAMFFHTMRFSEIPYLIAVILGVGILFSLVHVVVYYLITKYLLTKRLNLY